MKATAAAAGLLSLSSFAPVIVERVPAFADPLLPRP